VAARPAVLDRLKALLKTARAEANRQLVSDGNGRRCAEGLAKFQDELIRLVYDYTCATSIAPPTRPTPSA
jgi:[protein-PII] uridylyltransferase